MIRLLRALCQVLLMLFAGPSLMALADHGLDVEIYREDLSITRGKPFWIMIEVKPQPGVQFGWKMSAGDWPATHLQIKTPKGLRVGRLIWPSPVVEKNDSSALVYYGSNTRILAQILWSESEQLWPSFEGLQADLYLEAQVRYFQKMQKEVVNTAFALPTIRLPSEVPLVQDPLIGADFARARELAPKEIDTGLVDWTVAAGGVQMAFNGVRLLGSSSDDWYAICYECADDELHPTPIIAVHAETAGAQERVTIPLKEFKALLEARCTKILLLHPTQKSSYIVTLEITQLPEGEEIGLLEWCTQWFSKLTLSF